MCDRTPYRRPCVVQAATRGCPGHSTLPCRGKADAAQVMQRAHIPSRAREWAIASRQRGNEPSPLENAAVFAGGRDQQTRAYPRDCSAFPMELSCPMRGHSLALRARGRQAETRPLSRPRAPRLPAGALTASTCFVRVAGLPRPGHSASGIKGNPGAFSGALGARPRGGARQ